MLLEGHVLPFSNIFHTNPYKFSKLTLYRHKISTLKLGHFAIFDMLFPCLAFV